MHSRKGRLTSVGAFVFVRYQSHEPTGGLANWIANSRASSQFSSTTKPFDSWANGSGAISYAKDDKTKSAKSVATYDWAIAGDCEPSRN